MKFRLNHSKKIKISLLVSQENVPILALFEMRGYVAWDPFFAADEDLVTAPTPSCELEMMIEPKRASERAREREQVALPY
jgi:hypothetical protein